MHKFSAPGLPAEEGLADLLLAAAVTVTFMKLCDFLFVHSHTVGEWSVFPFMALIGLAGSFLAGRYNSLPAADFGSELWRRQRVRHQG